MDKGKSSYESVEANLEMDKMRTGGIGQNRSHSKPGTESEKANQEIQDEFYQDEEENFSKDARLTLFREPKD